MRRLLGALLLTLVPVMAIAQNTTGSLSRSATTPSTNTTVTQVQTPTTGTTNGAGATTGGTTTGTTNGTTTSTAATGSDVAIVLCAQDFSTNALIVFTASVSAGGATITPGAQCAQALSDLFVAGYGVIDVQPFNQQLQYTLVR